MISLLIVMAGLSFENPRPKFADYPARNVLPENTPRAPIQLRTAFDRNFVTHLRLASQEKPNFAGRYHLSLWGCGSSCATGAIVDLEAGVAHRFPMDHDAYPELLSKGWFESCSMRRGPSIDFRLDSRLLVIVCIGRSDGAGKAFVDTHYLLWTGSRFEPLTRILNDKSPPSIENK